MKVNWINEKETIEKLIKEGVSYENIGRQYGVTGAAVKKAARKMGIELEQRREINPNEHFNKGVKQLHTCLNCGKEFEHSRNSKNVFCSRQCQGEYTHKKYIERWKNGEEDGLNGRYGISPAIRKYLFEKYNNKCQVCGWGEENVYSNNIPLQVHHIDGDYKNNREENLQLLCPNCHSLTDTFMTLNKNGRKDRHR